MRVVVLVLASLSVSACASAPAPRDEAATSRAFADLQVHEARLEQARLDSQRGESPCPARCEAFDAMTRARDALCALADSLADPDALRRCELARQSAGSGAVELHAACGCPASGG